MPRTCTICSHAERSAIDQALLQGESYRDIAGRCPVSKSALERHKRDHIPAKLAKAPAAIAEAKSKAEATAARLAEAQAPAVELVEAHAAKEEAEAGTLYEQLRGIGRDTREILEAAKGAKDHELALKAVARIEKQLELLARLLGEIDDSAKIAIGLKVTNAASSHNLDLAKLSPGELQQLRALILKAQPTTAAPIVHQITEGKGNL